MRWFSLTPIIAACAHTPVPTDVCRVIEQPAELGSCVGKTVTLRGVVTRTKIPMILGVDIDSSGEALADTLAEATGVLEVYVIPEDVDKDGYSAHKSPGTYYSLKSADASLAKPRAVR